MENRRCSFLPPPQAAAAPTPWRPTPPREPPHRRHGRRFSGRAISPIRTTTSSHDRRPSPLEHRLCSCSPPHSRAKAMVAALHLGRADAAGTSRPSSVDLKIHSIWGQSLFPNRGTKKETGRKTRALSFGAVGPSGWSLQGKVVGTARRDRASINFI